jgi:serine/threonine protein kinase/Flp pilus assembly protein TadD
MSSSPCVPDHQLLGLIASGAYGKVWLGSNAVGTLRAVKIVRREQHASAESFEREFRGLQKFEPVSRSHEGLVDILTLGLLHDGTGFYYVMELADDLAIPAHPTSNQNSSHHYPAQGAYRPRTLRADMKCRGALPTQEVIALGLKLTSALCHLHAQGLVHRDVKPSNIMFVQGEPKLADAGLVAATDEARSLVGTPGYIAPEGPGSPQADLYALGKVLYEAAFGKDRQEFPALPADIAARGDHSQLLELNEVIAKACAYHPAERYLSATDMRRDLELLQEGQSVKQRRKADGHLQLIKRVFVGMVLVTLITVGAVVGLRSGSLEGDHPAYKLSKDLLARNEYRNGDQCLRRDTKEGLEQALEYFTAAVRRDPKFTMAYNGLFEVYIAGDVIGLSSAQTDAHMRTTANKLLELAPNLAETHAAMAFIGFLDGKWEKAEPEFLEAIKLNPKCAMAHCRYGFCLYTAGRADEALTQLRLADSIDSTRPRIKKCIGNALYIKRQFHEAIAEYEKLSKFEPSYPLAHDFMGRAYRALDDYPKAIDEFERSRILLGQDPQKTKKYFDQQRRAYERGGANGYWSNCLAEAQADHSLVDEAICRAHLKDTSQALALLEQASAKEKDSVRQSILFEECFDPIHADPRFMALLKDVGLRK